LSPRADREVFKVLTTEARARLRECAAPQWVAPMLATLTGKRFNQAGWIFERKLDGERCLAFRDGATVRLLSRNRRLLNGAYPEIAEALERERAERFVLDGEVVALAGSETSFARLQRRMQIDDPLRARAAGVPVHYYAFDLLYLEGYDTTALPLLERKRLLAHAFALHDPVRYTEHRERDGEALFREACRRGWEGLIAKRAEAPYVHYRSPDWLKLKCLNQQELVIGGWTDPKGARTGFGALLVGYYAAGELRYAGKVGTGYDEDTLRELGAELRALEQANSPFAADGAPARGAHWVTPRLVAEIRFSEWTGAGRLRQPRYLGLRRDKEAYEVVRERP
jgi:DNA ligase D-like protein (predicted ligase)